MWGNLMSLRNEKMKNYNLEMVWKACKTQTDHLISTRRPDLVIINKKKKKRICWFLDFAVRADYR